MVIFTAFLYIYIFFFLGGGGGGGEGGIFRGFAFSQIKKKCIKSLNISPFS